MSEATLADDGRWRYAAWGLLVGLLVGGLPRLRMKRPALVAEFGGWVGEYGVAGFENPGPDIMVDAAMLRPPHFWHLRWSPSAEAAVGPPETELLRMLRRGWYL